MMLFYSFLEIKDKLFHTEIIVSAVITALIYGFQLFFSFKNLQKNIIEFRADGRHTFVPKKNIKIEEAPFQAILYPGYLIRYTIGGFVITFHILIFVAVIFRLIWNYFHAFKWVLDFILPMLILYALQSLITQGIGKLIANHNKRNGPATTRPEASRKRNIHVRCCQCWFPCKSFLKNALQYFMLVASKTLEMNEIS